MNTRDKNFTRGKVERRRAQLEKSVARYLCISIRLTGKSHLKNWRRRQRI